MIWTPEPWYDEETGFPPALLSLEAIEEKTHAVISKDLFHPECREEYIWAVLGLMAKSRHTFRLTTRYPSRALDFLDTFNKDRYEMARRADEEFQLATTGEVKTSPGILLEQWAPGNIVLAVYLETQEDANYAVPKLIGCDVGYRAVYVRPKEKIDLFESLFGEKYRFAGQHPDIPGTNTLGFVDGVGHGGDWIIAEAGENLPHPNLFTFLRDQAAESGTAFLFEGWGNWLPTPNPVPGGVACYDETHDNCRYFVRRSEFDPASFQLEGETYNECPEGLTE